MKVRNLPYPLLHGQPLNMFSNICQSYIYIQKLEISYEFDVCIIFTAMYVGFTDCTKHASTTDTLLAFTQTKLTASTEINSLSRFIHVLGLDEKREALLTI